MSRRSLLLGLAIGKVLADSSVVTLALPDVLREFDVEITTEASITRVNRSREHDHGPVSA